MMLTKLKAVAAALVLGVITAGAIVSAQPTGGGRGAVGTREAGAAAAASRRRQGGQHDRRLDTRRREGREERVHR